MNDVTNGVGFTDAGILSLLGNVSGSRFADGRGTFASPGSNAVRLDRNAQETENQADCTRAVIGQGLDTILTQFESAERGRQFSDVSENQFRMELRIGDHARAQTQLINDNARQADNQFCDLKATISELKAGQKLLAVKIDNNAEMAQKNAEIIALQAKLDNRDQTINNYCCPQPARCVDPCCNGGSSQNDVATAVVNALAPALNGIATAIAGLRPGNS